MPMPARVPSTYELFMFALESTIVDLYNTNPELVDHNVSKATEGLIRTYQAKQKGKNPPKLRLKDIEVTLHDKLNDLCNEWEDVTADDGNTYSSDVILLCLKQIQKSLRLWGTDYGIRAYLDFVKPYINQSGYD